MSCSVSMPPKDRRSSSSLGNEYLVVRRILRLMVSSIHSMFPTARIALMAPQTVEFGALMRHNDER